MSAGSSRPPVPRPSPKKSSAPPPPPDSSCEEKAPPSSPVIEIPKAYASQPPVIRDRAPSATELAAEDLELVEEPGADAPPRRPSKPPPPPPVSARAKLLGPRTPVVVVPAPISKVTPRPIDMPLPVPLPRPAAVPVIEPPKEIEAPPESRVQVKREPSVLDPMDVLFDGIYELNFVDSTAEAADVCASALAKALRARAVVIHSHDLVRRELRAIGAHGVSPSEVLFTTEASEDDLVASAVICNQAPVTMRFDGELPKLAPKRLTLVGAPRTLVAVPALSWGRCIAIIEVIDADERVAERAADSAAYVAERLAEFLMDRAAA
ncbi:MAG: hypothetical protein JST00_18525 [Deltaproteobacteria bacterium]|nr:hypothetical protein [Deltaproteobacteria bacterium]